MLSAGVAFIAIPVVIVLRIVGSYLPGFGSITIAILLLGGIQLIALGVIGEYVGRIYDEVKHRPLYIVREELNRPPRAGPRRARRSRRPRRPAGPHARADRLAERPRARASVPSRAPLRAEERARVSMEPMSACVASPSRTAGPRRLLAALGARARARVRRGRRQRRGGRSLPRIGPGPLPVRRGADRSASAPRACCAFPRRSRWTRKATCTWPTSSSYVVQKFSAAGAFETRVGLLRRRPRAVRPDRRARHRRRRRTCTWSTRATTGSRSSTPTGTSSPPWGHRGSELGEFQLRLLAEPTPSRRAGASRSRAATCTWPTASTTASSASTSKAAKRCSGAHGQRPRPVLLPPRRGGQRKRGDRQPTTTTTASRSSTPNGAFQGEAGTEGAGRGSSAFPTASRWTPPATCTWPTTSTTASSSSPRSSRFLGAWGGCGSKPGQLAFPRALASDPAGDTYVADTANDRIEVFDPERRLPAHDRHLRARTRAC